LGFDVEPERWKQKQWFFRLNDALATIRATVPRDSTFILVDDDQWGVQGTIAERRCLPFLERQGKYWGPADDDQTAIEQLARLQAAGADFLAFAWPSFWWLEHYRALHQLLQSRYGCVARNENLLVFDLRRERREHFRSGSSCASH
jgi:hypothetical protein